MEFHDNILDYNDKCFQINTNMPGIGSLIREIVVGISDKREKAIFFVLIIQTVHAF